MLAVKRLGLTRSLARVMFARFYRVRWRVCDMYLMVSLQFGICHVVEIRIRRRAGVERIGVLIPALRVIRIDARGAVHGGGEGLNCIGEDALGGRGRCVKLLLLQASD
jgi:hypothetical protein